ncbi:hypothetical protein GYMLUDRAFT_172674 [Collybiopsis luxurians FD-317 M1]|uniref:HMG domain-containing protein n=1 Tax=Collybiopsis luxurians FD-317 M1 TaxID=944289 RepID=A0A0D0BQU0_9AGAR|nr:hypothetical protein GYMLUDRAFT_172674 [Collybiopsis luxurians FD-317 M1]
MSQNAGVGGPSADEEGGFWAYSDAVQCEAVGFVQLHSCLYAVEGWLRETGQGNRHWYHFELSGGISNCKLVCLCPAGIWSCFHKCYYALYKDELNNQDWHQVEEGEYPAVILFHKEPMGFQNDKFIHLLSIAKTNDTVGISNRAIVKFEGTVGGEGTWKCSMKEGFSCAHITAGQNYLQGSSVGSDRKQNDGGIDISSTKQFSWRSLQAISHLPILPPRWCMLPQEKEFYPCPCPVWESPAAIKLAPTASCACVDGGQAFHDPSCSTVIHQCLVYTLTQAFAVQIELQPCPRCPVEHHWYIGPDLQDAGLFNYNNSSIVSHELLNEYISAFSSAETPFEPWVNQISRRYDKMQFDSLIPFISGGLFHSIWFAYAHFIQFEGDKSHPSCGIYPDNIIWDGVSIAFGCKHVNGELQPPTLVGNDAILCSSRPCPRQEWLPDGKM